MVSTDPISDMFSRIRNAIAVNKTVVSMPHSKIKEEVARLLVTNGFLRDVRINSKGIHKELEIKINGEDEPSVITEITRISRPGRREYVKSTKISLVKHGRGITIISTSKGLMTGAEAIKQKLGGEVVCEVY